MALLVGEMTSEHHNDEKNQRQITKDKSRWFHSLHSQGLRRTVKQNKVGENQTLRVLNSVQNGDPLNTF